MRAEDKTFRKMRRRFSLLVMALSAITLGVLAFTAGSIVYKRTANSIVGRVEMSVGEQKPDIYRRPDDVGRNCSYIMLDEEGDVTKKMGAFELYSNEDIKELASAFLNVDGNKIRLNDRYYYFNVYKTAEGYTIAAYDYSAERSMLVWLIFIAALLWAFGSALSGLIAYLLSESIISPAKDALKKQRDLVANASHELKTPITVISADLSIITADPSATVSDNEAWLNAISDQTKRMQSMVGEMLELSRLDSDNYKIDYETIDLSDMVDIAAMTIEGVAYENNVTVECNVDKVSIVSNRALVDKIIYILFDNALKYVDNGGKISVELYADKKDAVLKVKNTGKGISAEKLPHIFERFYKGDESHSGETHSFGLGLSMAKRIVEKLDGKIECTSTVGELTTFTVRLPLSVKKRKLKACGLK